MDTGSILTLIKTHHTADSIGQQLAAESRRDVYAKAVYSASQSEFFAAGQSGLVPEYKFIVPADEYQGETIVEYNGTRLSVYRTYRRPDGDLELHTERRAGNESGSGQAC